MKKQKETGEIITVNERENFVELILKYKNKMYKGILFQYEIETEKKV